MNFLRMAADAILSSSTLSQRVEELEQDYHAKTITISSITATNASLEATISELREMVRVTITEQRDLIERNSALENKTQTLEQERDALLADTAALLLERDTAMADLSATWSKHLALALESNKLAEQLSAIRAITTGPAPAPKTVVTFMPTEPETIKLEPPTTYTEPETIQYTSGEESFNHPSWI